MRKQLFTVAQVNRYIKRLLEEDTLLSGVYVEGELSNVKPHSSGHLYFTLKDESAAINAVMFKSNARALAFEPRNGMKAVLFGYISLYEKTGQYQLYAEYMEPAGVGDLQAAFIQLRDRLQAEGLFEQTRKRPIPAYVCCVAVITSPTGAAVRDILRIIRNRNPAVKVVVAPALVQGAEAAADISRAIAEVNEWAGADVIILGRGGGSMEDLWAFNEEATARAVAGSAIPIISAVGHETDFTITDFVADLRAPTPTAAAAMAVFDRTEMLSHVQALKDILGKTTRGLLDRQRAAYRALTRSRFLQKPLEPVYQRQLYVQSLQKTADRLMRDRLAREKTALANREALLSKVSPYAAWKRGFAVVRAEQGTVLTSINALSLGETVTLQFQDGSANASVNQIIKR